jgi:hypothetical protein
MAGSAYRNSGYAGNQAALYTETDWGTCTGGPGIIWQNNTLYNVNYGIICHLTQTGGVAVTQTCKAYNNTIYLNPNEQSSTAAGFWADNGVGSFTLTTDVENNVIYHPDATGHGYLYTQENSPNTQTVTEANNLYYGANGSNSNTFIGSASTTLASWQANCGGGSACGTGDIWQSNPLTDLASVKLFHFAVNSPAITAGTSAVGVSRTMGAVTQVVGNN